jgi:hypothetical protein
MSKCFIIGRKATLLATGTYYIAEPFIVFEDEGEADGAADMVFRISGERPMKAEGAFYRRGETIGKKP